MKINGVGGACGTCVWEGRRRGVCRILEGNSTLGSRRRRWENNTKHVIC